MLEPVAAAAAAHYHSDAQLDVCMAAEMDAGSAVMMAAKGKMSVGSSVIKWDLLLGNKLGWYLDFEMDV